MEAVTGVRLSFWRAAVVFRIVSALFCEYLIFRWRHLYAELPVAVTVGLAIAVVTAAVAVLGLTGRAHRGWLVAADAAITIVLTGSSHWAQTPTQLHGGMTTLTTVWAAGPVIEAGLVFGWFGGLVVALVQFASTVLVRDGYDGNTIKNGVLLVIVGLISGYLMAWTALAETERAQLATLAERERLARTIHDEVLQVLGLV
ncbi:MAG: DUF5931 domain-containing protein, partial [Actinomycetota bacterium]|nr:DUF5931 domain-containing protein [Actinomycetota bacterium]